MRRYFVLFVVAAWPALASGQQPRPPQCDPGNGGLTLSKGYCAKVVADEVGPARHIAVAPNGDIFVAIRNQPNVPGGIVSLRDTDGDGRIDVRERFGESGGTGLVLRDGYLYLAEDFAVVRYPIAAGELKPSGPVETVVSGFPQQRVMPTKTLTFDNRSGLYVNIALSSSTCTETEDSKVGINPCVKLDNGGGIWRFDANRVGQVFGKDGERYATGLRHSNALAWHPDADALYLMQHGRSNLNRWPEYFTPERNAETPAEELQRIDQGADHGHPYCYYDTSLKKRVLAPEYGGDGTKEGDCAKYRMPAAVYPAHWAPNDLLIYTGRQFESKYRGGAFIAFHGGNSRTPLPQGGYNVVFQPMRDGKASGDYEIFAEGFAGKPTVMARDEAAARPMGLAQGPDGSLYVIDSVKGKLWRVMRQPAASRTN